MIKVAVIEDDAHKRERITRVIRETLGDTAIVNVAPSLTEGRALLEGTRYELLILDLNLPPRPDAPPQHKVGLRLLRVLAKGDGRLKKPLYIIGLSGVEEARNAAREDFRDEGWQLIDYDASSDEWERLISNRLMYVAGYEAARGRDVDLAIVTALRRVELEAVLRLDADWERFRLPGDSTPYHRGHFKRVDRSFSVVAASAHEMGMPAAACLSMKMIQQFRPACLAMPGICAGVGLNPGDIAVASQCHDYGSGKWSATQDTAEFSPAPNYVSASDLVRDRAMDFASRNKLWLSQVQDEWPGSSVDTRLAVQVGPMASGAAVLEDAGRIDAIRRRDRKLIAVEMEAYGVFLAGRLAPEPRPLVLVAKSVCDAGKPPKTDEHQAYAAYTSARFLHEFFLSEIALEL